MYNCILEKDEMIFASSSRLCNVDRIVDECKKYIVSLGYEDSSDFVLIIRELLINSIEHGNRNVIEKNIECRIENRGRGRFKIVVEDEGDGFEYNKLNLTLPKYGNDGRRCGFPLIYALSDMVRFNTKGNQITVYITIPAKIKFVVRFDDIKVVITPSGDITATSAEEFRTTLMKLYDKGHTVFYFDLSKVEDIDSISLGVFFSFGKMLKDRAMDNGKNGAKPLLANVDKRLSNFFILTGLDQLYTINLNGKEM